ncbi:MAG: mycofactocin biosynthesis chaperone MftB [Firmicutes bacterium]|nr:mycofactocin biosynthesis chaperone MftB [Bacillota bacterium]
MEKFLYRLAPGVTVRKESFGLLFYNAKDTNLTFINSGDLIEPESFDQERELLEFTDRCASENSKKIDYVLKELVKRGLLLERRVFI